MKFKVNDYVLVRTFELLYPSKIIKETSSDFYIGTSKYISGSFNIYFSEILTVLTEKEYTMTPVDIKDCYPEFFI
jgi:hypothetical protein